MPAVLLSRLEQQIEHLAGFFNQPDDFYFHLTELLELYSDRTYHAGNEIPSSSRLPSYRIPGIVILNLEMKIRKLAKTESSALLMNADLLWKDVHLETKHLAIQIIGNAPLSEKKEVVSRVVDWGLSCSDNYLLEYLLQNGTRTILTQMPAFWLNIIQSLLSENTQKDKILGLKALFPLVQEEKYQDLPAILDTIHPITQKLGLDLFPEMLALYEKLMERFPAETTASLKTTLASKPSPAMVRLIRKLLPSLPPQSQLALRAIMEEDDKSTPGNHPSTIKNRPKTRKTAFKPRSKG